MLQRNATATEQEVVIQENYTIKYMVQTVLRDRFQVRLTVEHYNGMID
jgi:hypothetical protein